MIYSTRRNYLLFLKASFWRSDTPSEWNHCQLEKKEFRDITWNEIFPFVGEKTHRWELLTCSRLEKCIIYFRRDNGIESYSNLLLFKNVPSWIGFWRVMDVQNLLSSCLRSQRVHVVFVSLVSFPYFSSAQVKGLFYS